MNHPELLTAIDSALAGQWDATHQIVQQLEGDPVAAWIHAVLHKIEGDLSNSEYWYRRAGKMKHLKDETRAELETIRQELKRKETS